jgi:hypothetical protein
MRRKKVIADAGAVPAESCAGALHFRRRSNINIKIIPASFFGRLIMPSNNRAFRLGTIASLSAGLFLASLACSGLSFQPPTATPTATLTMTPSATATATAAPTETATETMLPTATRKPTKTVAPTVSYLDWPAVFTDTFDADYGGWYTGKNDNEYATSDVSIVGGRYLIKITSKRGFFWWFPANTNPLGDFYVSADVKRNKSPENADYGLVFRGTMSKSYYYFYLNAQAKQYAAAGYVDGQWSTIIRWTHNDSIDPAGGNNLAVLAQGSTFTLFLNGKQVNSFEDSDLKSGYVGVGFEMQESGQYLEIEYDNFIIQAPK